MSFLNKFYVGRKYFQTPDFLFTSVSIFFLHLAPYISWWSVQLIIYAIMVIDEDLCIKISTNKLNTDDIHDEVCFKCWLNLITWFIFMFILTMCWFFLIKHIWILWSKFITAGVICHFSLFAKLICTHNFDCLKCYFD